MNSEAKPTLGAMRAAVKISGQNLYGENDEKDKEINKNAQIIDEETGLKELLEALKETWAQMDTSFLIDSTILKIKAAIAKAEA